MIIAFKRNDKSSVMGQMVSLAQKLNGESGYEYKHCEILFPEIGEAIAARTEEGVKVRPISQIIKNPAVWDFYEVPADDEKARNWLLEQLDAEYNYGAVLGWYALGLALTPENVFYCSELVYIVLRDFAQLPIDRTLNAARITPAYLRQLLVKAGAKPIQP
ncbi:hypothetical protein [Siphonobacter sp.]|uniref:hypothetical protein n=1 Tax=Siphonobacter sp. TaxID=1869184 RepID=UPI003B3BA939